MRGRVELTAQIVKFLLCWIQLRERRTEDTENIMKGNNLLRMHTLEYYYYYYY